VIPEEIGVDTPFEYPICPVARPLEIGTTYWYIGECGGVSSEIWDGDAIDNHRLHFGLVFKTKYEASVHVRIMRSKARVRAVGQPEDEKWLTVEMTDTRWEIQAHSGYAKKGNAYLTQGLACANTEEGHLATQALVYALNNALGVK